MDDNTTPNNQATTAATPIKVSKPIKYKLLIVIFIVTTLGLGIMLLVQMANTTALQKEHQAAMIQLQEESALQLETEVLNTSKRQLPLVMKPLVWAVRSALIRKNDDEIAQYFYELVQEEAIKEVILADIDGQIKVSTNKKNENQPFKAVYPVANLNVNKVSFTYNKEAYQIIAPILSLDQKLGTLFIEIERKSTTVQQPESSPKE